MPLPKDKTIITITIDTDVKALLVKYSKEMDVPLSKLARNLIYIALDDFKLLKKTGFIPVLKVFRDMVESYVSHEGVKKFLTVIEDKKPTTISVVVDSSVKETLDSYSDYLGLPLNIFGRNLIYIGLDQLTILRAAGFVKLTKMVTAFKIFVSSYQKSNTDNENHKSDLA